MAAEPAANEPDGPVTLDRCKALSDGVIAIAMTLLVLGIDVSQSERASGETFGATLLRISDLVVVYVASFWLLGTYWILHSAILDCFRRSDRTLIWLNLLFLLPVTFIPFVAKAKEIFRYSELAIVLLCAANIAIGLCLLLLWRYGTSHPVLLRRPIDDATRTRALRRIAVSPILLSVLAIVASWVDVYLTTALILLIPLYHLRQPLIEEKRSAVRTG
jgi:uncharacterized membrane protein